MEGGIWSRPITTVAPVVVKPDTASKNASTKLKWGPITNGIADKRLKTSQNSVTMMNPSRRPKSPSERRVGSHRASPMAWIITNDSAKCTASPSSNHNATRIGGMTDRLNIMHRNPTMPRM